MEQLTPHAKRATPARSSLPIVMIRHTSSAMCDMIVEKKTERDLNIANSKEGNDPKRHATSFSSPMKHKQAERMKKKSKSQVIPDKDAGAMLYCIEWCIL